MSYRRPLQVYFLNFSLFHFTFFPFSFYIFHFSFFSDGGGRTGTYCLLDMVLNRISKGKLTVIFTFPSAIFDTFVSGVKEIDIAAALEHLRDQRMKSIRTMDQFEFVLASVAEEVQAVLKALPQ